MSISSPPVILKVSIQLAALMLFWWLGTIIQKLTGLPISGAVIGLFLVLIGLLTGLLKLPWIKSGADFILAELVLFFIPCCVGLLNYKDIFLTEGWQLIVTILLGTIVVMVSTAYAVNLGFKIEKMLKQKSPMSKKSSDSQLFLNKGK